MFRLLTFLCLFHFSVGITIRSRIILYDDPTNNFHINSQGQLYLRVEELSEDDTSGMVYDVIEMKNLTSFPIESEISYTPKNSAASQLKLLASIKKGPIILYVGSKTVPITANIGNAITVDIPVRGRRAVTQSLENLQRLAFPELVGQQGTYAVEYIKQKTGLKNVVIVPEGSIVTMDFRFDRIRVFVDKQGIVTRPPRTG